MTLVMMKGNYMAQGYQIIKRGRDADNGQLITFAYTVKPRSALDIPPTSLATIKCEPSEGMKLISGHCYRKLVQ